MKSYNFNWNAISGGAPYITFSSLGIAFNSVSISKLGNPQKVIIGFDEDNLAIAVKPYENQQDIKAYEFANRVKHGWIRIGCKDFIKYLSSISNITFEKAKKYVAHHDSQGNCLVVELQTEDKQNECKENG